MKLTKKRTEFTFLIKVVQLARKGGTVVPPSDFQSVATECAERQQVIKKPLAHTGPQAHTRAMNPLRQVNFPLNFVAKRTVPIMASLQITARYVFVKRLLYIE